MKVAARCDTTHNPCHETHWVSCLRENLTSSSYGEGLETGRATTQVPRQSFTRQTAFFELTTTLSCAIRTLGYPQAALLAFCLALVAYNAVAVIKAALRGVHGKQQGNDAVSSYYLALEIRQTYDGMMVAIPAPHWEVFRAMSPAALAEVLRELAAAVKLSKYRKHPRGPKKKPPTRTAYKNGCHVATARLIAQR